MVGCWPTSVPTSSRSSRPAVIPAATRASSPIRRGRRPRRTCRGGSRTAGSRRSCSTSTTRRIVTRLLELVDRPTHSSSRSTPAGWTARGLGVDVLLARNPQLVVTSISPFGRTGPHAHWSATDLTVAASTGEMWLSGDADRPPVRLSIPAAVPARRRGGRDPHARGVVARADDGHWPARRRLGPALWCPMPHERPGVPRTRRARAVPPRALQQRRSIVLPYHQRVPRRPRRDARRRRTDRRPDHAVPDGLGRSRGCGRPHA